MSETPIYKSTELAENSSNPEVPVNNMIRVVERAANSLKEWTVVGDFTINEQEFAEGILHELNGSPSAAFAFGVPAVARFFIVRNNTGKTCTIYVNGQSGTGVDLADDTTTTYHSDGVNVTAMRGGGGGGGALEHLETFTATGTPTSHTFNISGSGPGHLELYFNTRGSVAADEDQLQVRFNGDSGANYDWCQLFTSSGSPNGVKGEGDTQMSLLQMPAGSSTAGFSGGGKLSIYDYTGSLHKTCSGHGIQRTSAVGARMLQYSGEWHNAAAITSVTVTIPGGMANGTSFSLYRINQS